MTLPLGPKAELEQLLAKLPSHAVAARERLLGIKAYIERLEAEIATREAAARAGAEARVKAQPPERRRELASLAARRRWGLCERRAFDKAQLFTE